MSGLTVAETASNVGAFAGAWVNFLNANSQYSQNPGSKDAQQSLISSASALLSATTALRNSNPLISATLGSIAGVTGLQADINAYQDALSRQDVNGQNTAMAAIVSDGAGIGGGTATAIRSVAALAGDDALVSTMTSIASDATELGLIATVVQAAAIV